VLVGAITFLGLIAVTFFIGRVIPIDPALAIVGDRAPAHVVERVREELGLNLPLYQQFVIYVKGVLEGNFGNSVLTTNPVMTDIRRVFPATMELATLGTLIGAIFGIPLGVLAAVKRGSIMDQIVRIIGLIGYSVPIFWLGLLALLVFYAKLGWTSGPGRIDVVYEYTFTPITGFYLLDAVLQHNWDALRNIFSFIILPASLLGYFSLAYISRMTRSFMLNELEQEYIVAARAKGLSETRIIWGHALRNAAVPLVTVIALSYAGLLEGSVLTETVFSWPGLGMYITNSLQNADMNAVLGGTIVIGTVFVAINLLSDILYRALDPRTRAR
jgi:peptide/nickel transport system permease protein